MSDDQPEWERILSGLAKRETRTAAADVASDPRPAAVTANDRTISPGCIVAWAHAGAWQYGLVQGVTQREGRAYVRPIDKAGRCLPKPLGDLTLISDRAGLLRSIQAAHAELAQ